MSRAFHHQRRAAGHPAGVLMGGRGPKGGVKGQGAPQPLGRGPQIAAPVPGGLPRPAASGLFQAGALPGREPGWKWARPFPGSGCKGCAHPPGREPWLRLLRRPAGLDLHRRRPVLAGNRRAVHETHRRADRPCRSGFPVRYGGPGPKAPPGPEAPARPGPRPRQDARAPLRPLPGISRLFGPGSRRRRPGGRPRSPVSSGHGFTLPSPARARTSFRPSSGLLRGPCCGKCHGIGLKGQAAADDLLAGFRLLFAPSPPRKSPKRSRSWGPTGPSSGFMLAIRAKDAGMVGRLFPRARYEHQARTRRRPVSCAPGAGAAGLFHLYRAPRRGPGSKAPAQGLVSPRRIPPPPGPGNPPPCPRWPPGEDPRTALSTIGPGRGPRWTLAVPFSPAKSTPPRPGSTAQIKSARRMSFCPTRAAKG